ncbi:dienelactone hydrolase family protein [Planococcus sp. N028]|uniref:Dienelactone hydrolase family protein n=1 Tax=Planococcus shixiaomingii TaxID=3058393 RepID=A0ABT8MYZ7_9BACL|nr:dienelactone hydrolase family protein [Planococcus sp. N028]MDN7240868.1 dienelactone hydrolase family protein [Planococcus sp. N028]
MGLHTEWMEYGSGFRGYLAHIDKISEQAAPAVIVIQEVWGVDEHIQDVTRRFAQAGYIAFAPELFSRQGEIQEQLKADRIEEVKRFLDELPPSGWGNVEERNAALAKHPEEKQQRITATLQTLFGGLNPAEYVDQLVATTSFLRGSYSKEQGVGSVGFCLGGALSASLAAQDPELKGAIIFYGNAPKPDAMEAINCPVLGFYGQKDKRITGQVADLAKNMDSLGKSFDYTIYEGAEHAFFNDTRRSYHNGASRDAFAKSLHFFNEVLPITSAE